MMTLRQFITQATALARDLDGQLRIATSHGPVEIHKLQLDCTHRGLIVVPTDDLVAVNSIEDDDLSAYGSDTPMLNGVSPL